MTDLARLRALHRYSITGEGASLGYFRLVEEKDGAWVQWPELSALLVALEREAPASNRLRALARAQADFFHMDAFEHGDGKGHNPHYADCLHPDCVLVRAALPQEPTLQHAFDASPKAWATGVRAAGPQETP